MNKQYKLLKDKMHFGPDYNNPVTGGELKTGTIFSVLHESYSAWEHMPDRGHTYYLLGWKEGEEEKSAWVRTYSHQTVYNFAEDYEAPKPEVEVKISDPALAQGLKLEGPLTHYPGKKLSLEEFIAFAKSELDAYQKDWEGKNSNDFHSTPHTWNEWWGTFHRYYSWEDM